MPATLGVDFGTSNTGAGVVRNGKPFLIALEPGRTTFPTSIFYDTFDPVTLYGSAANAALMREVRWVGHARKSLIEVVARFLAELKDRAEAATGETFETALGYGRLACGTVGLIVDIGGGTSDFTVFRADGAAIDVLASHGVRVGGTDFDKALSLAHVMPLLGQGSDIRFAFGRDTHTAPNAIFQDLATWEKIPFLYTAKTCRDVAGLLKLAVQPDRIGRLARVLQHELGHDLAFAVEASKIAVNAGEKAGIALDVVEPGLTAAIGLTDLDAALAGYAKRIGEAARHALALADVPASGIGTVILVGGSSLMRAVELELRRVCPGATVERGDAFTAIADGLAIAAARPFDSHKG